MNLQDKAPHWILIRAPEAPAVFSEAPRLNLVIQALDYQRERETERQNFRDAEMQRGRGTERQGFAEAEGQRGREAERLRCKEAEIQRYKEAEGQIGRGEDMQRV